MTKKICRFLKEVLIRIIKNDLYTKANAMTYRMILAVVPLLIVMIASLAFFNIDIYKPLNSLLAALPEEVAAIVNSVIEEVFETKHISIISTSAAIALFSASSGFIAMIDGMNSAFAKKRKLNFIRTRLICMVLVVVFVAIILLSLLLLIFGDLIYNFLVQLDFIDYIPRAFNVFTYLAIGIFIGVVFLIILHKTAIDKNIPVKAILPGAFFTVGAWLIASVIFNFYVNNFYRYSIVYGSIGTFFVFALWMNILSYVILIGSQINAVLYDKNFMKKLKD